MRKENEEPELSDSEIEELRASVLDIDKHFKIEITGGRGHYLKTALQLGLDIVYAIAIKKPQLLISDSRVFVTSDNPVTLGRPRGSHPFWGVGFLEGIVVLPLSPKVCLVLTNEEPKKQARQISREGVNSINWQTMFYAHKYVFSSMNSKDISTLYGKTEDGKSEQVIIS